MKKQKKQSPKKQDPSKKNLRDWRNLIWYLLITFVLISIVSASLTTPKNAKTMDFSQFVTELDSGKIKNVTIKSSERLITGSLSDGTSFRTHYIDYPNLVEDIL